MAFSSQFSLSVELTRLIPLQLVANKAAEAVMRLARDLRNSGSDIVIEEDLASIFGRCKIADGTSSSFKTIVNKSGVPYLLFEGIALETGPGPTVVRALQSVPYFATVIQCSFLTATHEKTSLAATISLAFEKM
jgi:hypothetical protein